MLSLRLRLPFARFHQLLISASIKRQCRRLLFPSSVAAAVIIRREFIIRPTGNDRGGVVARALILGETVIADASAAAKHPVPNHLQRPGNVTQPIGGVHFHVENFPRRRHFSEIPFQVDFWQEKKVRKSAFLKAILSAVFSCPNLRYAHDFSHSFRNQSCRCTTPRVTAYISTSSAPYPFTYFRPIWRTKPTHRVRMRFVLENFAA